VDVLNAAAKSGDTRELRQLGHPECEACRNFAESIDFLYRDGGGIRGGVFTVTVAESPGDDDPNTATVTVIYDVTASAQLAADGTVARDIPALVAQAGDMSLVRSGPKWLLREFTAT
jgi:hypothetical protein